MLTWENVAGGGAAAFLTAIGGWIVGRRKTNAEAALLETEAESVRTTSRHVHWDEAMELITKLTEEVDRIGIRLDAAEQHLAECKTREIKANRRIALLEKRISKGGS